MGEPVVPVHHSHSVLLSVCILVILLGNGIVEADIRPLLELFGLDCQPINKDKRLSRKLYVFCIMYIYTHSAKWSLSIVAGFTVAEILHDQLNKKKKSKK